MAGLSTDRYGGTWKLLGVASVFGVLCVAAGIHSVVAVTAVWTITLIIGYLVWIWWQRKKLFAILYTAIYQAQLMSQSSSQHGFDWQLAERRFYALASRFVRQGKLSLRVVPQDTHEIEKLRNWLQAVAGTGIPNELDPIRVTLELGSDPRGPIAWANRLLMQRIVIGVTLMAGLYGLFRILR